GVLAGVEEALQLADGLVAALAHGADERIAVAVGERNACRVEMEQHAVVDDVVGGLEIFAAAYMDRRERGECESGRVEEAIHGRSSASSGTSGAYPWCTVAGMAAEIGASMPPRPLPKNGGMPGSRRVRKAAVRIIRTGRL